MSSCLGEGEWHLAHSLHYCESIHASLFRITLQAKGSLERLLYGGVLVAWLGRVPYTPDLRYKLTEKQCLTVAALIGAGLGMGMQHTALAILLAILAAFVVILGLLSGIPALNQTDHAALQTDWRQLPRKQAAAERLAQQLPAGSLTEAAQAVGEYAGNTLARLPQ